MSQKPSLVSQEYAQWAFGLVEALKTRGKEIKELKSHLRKLPSALQASGLAQTLLFYGKKHKEIAQALGDALLKQRDVAACVKELAQKSASEYRMLAREAMQRAQWLKRFAEVMLEGEG